MDDDTNQAFELLKQRIISTHVLQFLNFTKPFTIKADERGTGLGAELMEDSRPIAYYSNAISPNSLENLSMRNKQWPYWKLLKSGDITF